MLELVMTKGIPASGKSHWADGHVKNRKPGTWVRVNKDTLRDMLHAGVFVKGRTEKQVLAARDRLIGLFLADRVSVIVDDTNLAPFHETRLRELADQHAAMFRVQDFTDVPVEVCIERDLQRARSVGERVIRRMHDRYLAPTPVPPPVIDGAPWAVVVDVDGTLAHMNGGRSPYDYSKVMQDTVDPVVRDLVRAAHAAGDVVLVVSGREDVCRDDTVAWLAHHDVPHHHVLMRAAKDMRPDEVVKREIYDTEIVERFNIRYILDDRNRVVDMWRGLGLKVLQVAPGDF